MNAPARARKEQIVYSGTQLIWTPSPRSHHAMDAKPLADKPTPVNDPRLET